MYPPFLHPLCSRQCHSRSRSRRIHKHVSVQANPNDVKYAGKAYRTGARQVYQQVHKIPCSKLTNLRSPDLDSFIRISKPSYELLVTMNDIELGYYIEQIYKLYKKNRADTDLFYKKENGEQKK